MELFVFFCLLELSFFIRKGKYHAIYIIQQVSKREWNVSILSLDIDGDK